MISADCSAVNNDGNYWAYVNKTKMELRCRSGGWTVIQSRGQYGNPPDFFYKTWSEYKNPFGILGKFYQGQKTTNSIVRSDTFMAPEYS